MHRAARPTDAFTCAPCGDVDASEALPWEGCGGPAPPDDAPEPVRRLHAHCLAELRRAERRAAARACRLEKVAAWCERQARHGHGGCCVVTGTEAVASNSVVQRLLRVAGTAPDGCISPSSDVAALTVNPSRLLRAAQGGPVVVLDPFLRPDGVVGITGFEAVAAGLGPLNLRDTWVEVSPNVRALPHGGWELVPAAPAGEGGGETVYSLTLDLALTRDGTRVPAACAGLPLSEFYFTKRVRDDRLTWRVAFWVPADGDGDDDGEWLHYHPAGGALAPHPAEGTYGGGTRAAGPRRLSRRGRNPPPLRRVRRVRVELTSVAALTPAAYRQQLCRLFERLYRPPPPPRAKASHRRRRAAREVSPEHAAAGDVKQSVAEALAGASLVGCSGGDDAESRSEQSEESVEETSSPSSSASEGSWGGVGSGGKDGWSGDDVSDLSDITLPTCRSGASEDGVEDDPGWAAPSILYVTEETRVPAFLGQGEVALRGVQVLVLAPHSEKLMMATVALELVASGRLPFHPAALLPVLHAHAQNGMCEYALARPVIERAVAAFAARAATGDAAQLLDLMAAQPHHTYRLAVDDVRVVTEGNAALRSVEVALGGGQTSVALLHIALLADLALLARLALAVIEATGYTPAAEADAKLELVAWLVASAAALPDNLPGIPRTLAHGASGTVGDFFARKRPPLALAPPTARLCVPCVPRDQVVLRLLSNAEDASPPPKRRKSAPSPPAPELFQLSNAAEDVRRAFPDVDTVVEAGPRGSEDLACRYNACTSPGGVPECDVIITTGGAAVACRVPLVEITSARLRAAVKACRGGGDAEDEGGCEEDEEEGEWVFETCSAFQGAYCTDALTRWRRCCRGLVATRDWRPEADLFLFALLTLRDRLRRSCGASWPACLALFPHLPARQRTCVRQALALYGVQPVAEGVRRDLFRDPAGDDPRGIKTGNLAYALRLVVTEAMVASHHAPVRLAWDAFAALYECVAMVCAATETGACAFTVPSTGFLMRHLRRAAADGSRWRHLCVFDTHEICVDPEAEVCVVRERAGTVHAGPVASL